MTVSRREFLQAASAAPLATQATGAAISIDATPRHELSPFLFMQFMEPLGTTDGSVEASWDHLNQRWRPDLVEATQELAPPMMRWGGLFSAYYRWREAVGPRAERKPMHNLMWGGIESNQIGTAEFLEFCKLVKAEPLMCVNFESEGSPGWRKNKLGETRSGDAAEAAEWVAHCKGAIRYWQIGNETSYAADRFKPREAIAKTIEFSRAMRKVDDSLKLIAWGDSGWAPAMLKEAAGHFEYLAFHNLFDPGPPCSDGEFRKDPARTWDVLMNSVQRQAKKITEIRQQTGTFPLALTESHFAMKGRDRCDLNSTWAAGVAYARFLNLHQRHGDVLKIANLGDFCGTRWQSNVIMIPTPGGRSYIMPVGKVTALYSKHIGSHAVRAASTQADLDIEASRKGDSLFVHVVNTSRTKAMTSAIVATGHTLTNGRAFEMTASDPFAEITSRADDPMTLKTRDIDPTKPAEFPAASVTVLKYELAKS